MTGTGQIQEPPPIDLQLVGQRARERRCALHLSKRNVASAIGISQKTLEGWENNGPPQLRDPSMKVPDTGAVDAITLHADLPFLTDEIQAVAAWLSRASVTARTTRFEDLQEQEKRRAEIFALRYGVGGPDLSTLQAVGDHFGLTRERVRQIVTVMSKRASGIRFALPRLAELRELADSSMATSVAEFTESQRKLLGPLLCLADADRFAQEITGEQLVNISGRSLWQSGNGLHAMIGSEQNHELAVAVRDAARKMIRSCGAANIYYVTGLASASLNLAVSFQDVSKILSAVEGMEWLSDDNDWFWFGMDTANNRVLQIAKKVLSVANCRLDVEELQQAAARSRRQMYEDRTVPPAVEAPKHVLREVLSRVPWLTTIQYDDFELNQTLPMRDVLSDSEFCIAEAILQRGGAISRHALNSQCVLSGQVSLPAMQLVLATSPIVRSLGFGVYGLRGVPFSEGALSLAIADLGYSHRQPSTSDENGWHEFEMQLTPFRWKTGNVDFPTRVVKAVPRGEYVMRGLAEGVFTIGGVASAPSRVTGFMKLLRETGLGEDDVLRVRLHPDLQQAEVSLAS